MFQFPAFASLSGWRAFRPPGCPIRISRDQGIFAPPPGFSQLITSFVASESQGIHRPPLLTFARPAPLRTPGVDMSSLVSSLHNLSLYFLMSIMSKIPSAKPRGRRDVENNGFEPLTLCLQSRCSSQLS